MSLSNDAIRVFIAVLDTGSFSAAARALGRVPSAISMAIANLETDLNVELFDRGGREPAPTDAARALEAHARFMLQQFDEWETHAASLSRGLESRLSLAIDPELLASDWTTPLRVLAADYPLLEIEVLGAPHADAMQLLHEGRVQLAIVYERVVFDGREAFQEMGSETLIPVMAPHHALSTSSQKPRLEDLAEYRQIIVASRDLAAEKCRFMMAHRCWRTDSHTAALSLMQAGLGWGLLPRSLVTPYLQAGTLVEIALDNATSSFQLWVDVVWSKHQPLGLAAQRFIEQIRDRQQSRPAVSSRSPPRPANLNT